MKKKLRKWIYVQKPQRYDLHCDKCGGSNITWSEFEGMIWCYKCQIDTPGDEGIFSGPIPVEVSKMMGISFDRFYLKSKRIYTQKIVGNKIKYVWTGKKAK